MKTQPKTSKLMSAHLLNLCISALSLFAFVGGLKAADETLPGTKAWDIKGEAAAEMVAGIDRYLTRAMEAAPKARAADWKPDTSSLEAYLKWLEPKRDRLRQIIGAVDERVPFHDVDMVATTAAPPVVGVGKDYKIIMVRWPVFEGVYAEGLMLEPQEHAPYASVIALPDADQTPEQLVGLSEGIPPEAQFARRLAECGCRVFVPMLIDRGDTYSGHARARFTNQPHREFLYRPAYQMGRHIIGYEVQKVLAAVDWFTSEARGKVPVVGVFGYGEGGLLALYSAAIDTRIDVVAVSGYFQAREQLWREPIYRNVWSLVSEYGDAELLTMIGPRTAIIEASKHPAIKGPPASREGRTGAAPGVTETPKLEAVRREFERSHELLPVVELAGKFEMVEPEEPALPGNKAALTSFLHALGIKEVIDDGGVPEKTGAVHDLLERNRRQFDELNEFTQRVARSSPIRRREFWKKADQSSLDKWVETTKFYRDYFWNEILGRLPAPEVPANPRSRQVYDEPKWRGYEVALDLYPDVFASGILLVPKDIKEGEHRPVVVCQHGLEGTSRDTITREGQGFQYYQSFAAKLADRGFVVFSPQNPYIGQDAFRVLQRKANPLKLSLFGFIVRQHERTLNWLAELPFVDKKRIGFYGLSYGGKTAVRVPAVLADQYALSICSGDWNDWITKTTSNDDPYSYLFYGEYEMFEFGLGDTFNYGELAGLIAPRPFMVERGHRDAVAPDEWVGYEYAKVRRLYDTLDIADRTTIEWFNGPHQIHAEGTFEFLHQHLKWPEPDTAKASATK